MDELKWLPIFETGVAEIDDDHRNLFTLAKVIHDGITGPTYARVQEFIDAARKHFDKEEKFLAQVGYPELDSHKEYHTCLLDKVEELKQVCDIGKH